MAKANAAVRTITKSAIPIAERRGSATPEVFCLPEQFYTAPNAEQWAGARRLLLAVLQDAIADWFRYRHDGTRRGERRHRETREWFSSRDKSWLYAFETICEYLNVDAEYIRRGLATPTDQTRNARMLLFRRAPVPAGMTAPQTVSSSAQIAAPCGSPSTRRRKALRRAHTR